MNSPLVSIIMPVFNDDKHVDDAIYSLLKQSYINIEVIAIDDCSKDKSFAFLKDLSKIDKRVKIFKNKQHIGLTNCLNKGILIAKGKYISRLDSDDLANKKRIERQVSFLEKNKNIFLIGTGYTIFNEMGVCMRIRPPSNFKKLRLILEKNNIICHSSIMFRNESGIFYRNKFYFGQDYDFYLTLITMGKKISCISQLLTRHRINPSGISCSYKRKQKQFRQKARFFYFERLRNGVDSYAHFDPNSILRKP
ncbi:MAG: glycosyltransferase family 2 protein [Candidatus Woesearchaeota archaeon]|nr:glycosyltransferase family 2 protein [Candidatus Woesearchaeota archaeon]